MQKRIDCHHRWLKTCANGATALDEQAQLSVWSFNLRTSLCEEQDGVDGWRFRAGGCAALIKQHSPAALCVQEATQPMLDSLCGRLGYQWYGDCRSGTGEDEHSALLWDPTRLRLLRGETCWLSLTPSVVSVGWDAQYPRIYTRGLFELVGGETRSNTNSDPTAIPTRVVLISTHFDHVGHGARLNSASLLRSLIGATESDEWQQAMGQQVVPTILCGDFNSVKSAEEGSVYHTLTAAGASGGFEDAWVICPAERRSYNGLSKDGSTIHKFKGCVLSSSLRSVTLVLLFESLRCSVFFFVCSATIYSKLVGTLRIIPRLDFVEFTGDGTVDLRSQSSAESAEQSARRSGGSARHIDWVLVHHPEGCHARLDVSSATVITQQVENLSSNRVTQRYPSDHYPLAVNFRVDIES